MAGSGKAGVDGTAKRTSRTGVEGALRRLQRVRGPVKRQQDAQGATAARVGTAPLIHTHRFHQDPWLSATAASPHGPRRSRPNHCRCACERAVARRALAAALSVAGASDTQSPPVALAAEPPCGPRRRSGVLDVALTGPGALTGDASCTRGWWPGQPSPHRLRRQPTPSGRDRGRRMTPSARQRVLRHRLRLRLPREGECPSAEPPCRGTGAPLQRRHGPRQRGSPPPRSQAEPEGLPQRAHRARWQSPM